jgi:phosphohistidine phosphatase
MGAMGNHDGMKVYFLRHGSAVEPGAWSGSESSRPLTPKGEEAITGEGRRMAGLGMEFGVILSSPYARALSTAELVARALGRPGKAKAEPRLAPGFGAAALKEILDERRGLDSILLVGHEPDFSEIISELTGGSLLEVKKGSLAMVEIDSASMRGILSFLIPPRFLQD